MKIKSDPSERLATLEEQGRWLAQEISEIKSDVKTLLAFKWKIFGTTAFIAIIVPMIVEFIIFRPGGLK